MDKKLETHYLYHQLILLLFETYIVDYLFLFILSDVATIWDTENKKLIILQRLFIMGMTRYSVEVG